MATALRAAPRSALALLLAASAAACRPDPPLPPDPDEPTPAATCAEAPLTLSRTEADSALEAPPWLQVCTACPAESIGFELEDGSGSSLPLASGWTPNRDCAVALADEPLPARPDIPARVEVSDDAGREGALDFDLPLADGRGPDPVDLGVATWVVPLDAGTLRLPGSTVLLGDPPPAVLVSLGPADSEARREVTFAPTRGDGVTQDLCVPTATLAEPARLLSRQVATPLVGDDPLPGGLLAERGALQARLTEDADALEDLVLLAVVDLVASEAATGLSPQEACSTWNDALGFDPCIPCGPPSEGLSGLPACATVVIETARAEAAPAPIVPLTPETIPPNCRRL